MRSKNQHGVHSPFVYQLLTNGMYTKLNDEIKRKFKHYRHELIQSKTQLVIDDFGAGSKRLSKRERSVSKMAKHAGSTLKKMHLLYRLSHYLQPQHMLELGTSLGIGSFALHLGNPNATLTTIEGSEALSEFTAAQFKKNGVQNIQCMNGTFETVLPPLTANNYDLIFFDGNHRSEATLNYIETLLPTRTNTTLWIFDDIYWSADMTKAWNRIQQLPEVTVTIDLFYFGLVFFRQEQAKEHFKLRV